VPRGRCVGIQGITCRFSDFARCARRPQPAQSVDPLALLEFWRCARCRAMTGITIPARPFGPHPLQEDATSLHRPGDAAIASWYISRTHELTATTLLPLQSRDGGPAKRGGQFGHSFGACAMRYCRHGSIPKIATAGRGGCHRGTGRSLRLRAPARASPWSAGAGRCNKMGREG